MKIQRISDNEPLSIQPEMDDTSNEIQALDSKTSSRTPIQAQGGFLEMSRYFNVLKKRVFQRNDKLRSAQSVMDKCRQWQRCNVEKYDHF